MFSISFGVNYLLTCPYRLFGFVWGVWSNNWIHIIQINHLPPACWSTFWKSIFKHQLGWRFDILDSISSFFCILTYAIIYVLIHHIVFWLYLYFLNILYFFKYSCTNIFHRRSLCTFYSNRKDIVWIAWKIQNGDRVINPYLQRKQLIEVLKAIPLFRFTTDFLGKKQNHHWQKTEYKSKLWS